jgi:CxxC motif-containing protein (DUF1111 family)
VRSVHVGFLAMGVFAAAGFHAFAQPPPAPPPGPVPVAGLTPAQQLAFDEGRRAFSKNYQIADGLGPVFNDESCADCHRNGGATNRTVRRFGRVNGGVFDPLAELGGSLIQSRGIRSVTTVDGTHDFVGERLPPEATVSALRRSQALQGLGLVDAVEDDSWRALAQAQLEADPSTAGKVHIVLDLSTGRNAVGKFGWKAQVPSLAQFAADALLNEIGITNPLFRDEVCPQGDCRALDFNPAPAMNDDGRDVEDLASFMTLLAPPPRGPITADAIAGEQLFMEIGCGSCHRPTVRTGPSPVSALNRVEFHPYSDFLLHDMGRLGDGITQGQATGVEMRTQPLWGLRNTNRLLHDAATVSIEEAIRRHDGQARAARDRFVALDPGPLAQLLAFLRSL